MYSGEDIKEKWSELFLQVINCIARVKKKKKKEQNNETLNLKISHLLYISLLHTHSFIYLMTLRPFEPFVTKL